MSGATPPLEIEDGTPASAAFEIKYVLAARCAAPLAAWLDAHCEPDSTYPEGHVRSLYLDTPGLRFLTEKIEGDFLKTKIRLRWYAADRQAPAAGRVWLEIKERQNLRRSKIRAEYLPDAAAIDNGDPRGTDIQRAIDLARSNGRDVPESLQPTLGVAYTRSRWLHAETNTRIALDRQIEPTWMLGPGRPASTALELRTAVLEFKGQHPEIPTTLAGVVRFGCRRTTFSKYFRSYARLVAGAESDRGDADAGYVA